MSLFPARMGTAESEVLHTLIHQHGGTWDSTRPAIYESRGFTTDLLERLTQRGHVKTTTKNRRTVYQVTAQGRRNDPGPLGR